MGTKSQTQREITLKAIKDRPGDPWPNGDGHVILGEPGSPREQKGYHEPGGLFSPAPGSFGVSFWIIDSSGKRIRSSEELRLDEIKQEFIWRNEGGTPAIATDTPYYSCSWSLDSDCRYHCELKAKSRPGTRLAVVFRSVGPAGSPLQSICREGNTLILNHRWSVLFNPEDKLMILMGDESRGELENGTKITAIDSVDGWAFARVESPRDALIFSIRSSSPIFRTPLSYNLVKSGLKMNLPCREFAASLDAQAANLLMGFTGKQTCPGEPTNYPLAWERDGAYSVLAMARSGNMTTAKELCLKFAEDDFFGGFGPEADAPGSAINALVETALISGDKEFQNWIWPHVKRKAAIIREMFDAASAIRKSWTGPIVPCHRGKEIIPIICEAAKDGLITGNMDLHYPILYINAVSFRGLSQAAKLAEQLGKKQQADKYAEFAGLIREAWLRNFSREDLSNDRNCIIALWPTWTISPEYAPFRDLLEKRREALAGKDHADRPLWTYFSVAEAHQWLLLGEQEKVWTTLKYFWANQCSPGLYTYWEGNGEENSFGLWQDIRGWLNPKHVTPHYWTAAEMLLLQLDMLAYVDESTDEPELVLGAGIPADWMKSSMQIEGIHSILGIIDWSYSDGKMEVFVRNGNKCRIRTGSGFPKETRITTCSTSFQ